MQLVPAVALFVLRGGATLTLELQPPLLSVLGRGEGWAENSSCNGKNKQHAVELRQLRNLHRALHAAVHPNKCALAIIQEEPVVERKLARLHCMPHTVVGRRVRNGCAEKAVGWLLLSLYHHTMSRPLPPWTQMRRL